MMLDIAKWMLQEWDFTAVSLTQVYITSNSVGTFQNLWEETVKSKVFQYIVENM